MIQRIKDFAAKQAKDDHIKDSAILIANSLILAGSGFIFWILASNMFPAADIGFASNLVSLLGIMLVVSSLGIDDSLIRFLPESKKKADLIGASMVISGGFSVIIGIIIIFVYSVLPRAQPLFSGGPADYLIFFLSGPVWVLFTLMEPLYIGLGKPKSALIKNSIYSILRIISLIVFYPLGFIGIYLAWAVSAFVSIMTSYLLFPFSMRLGLKSIKEIKSFSSLNYISNLFFWLRSLLLPIFAAQAYGPESAAYIYIAITLTSVFILVPRAISKSMLAHCSRPGAEKKKKLRKSLALSLLAASGMVVIVFAAGRIILSVFGRQYPENSLVLLRLFAVSGIFGAIIEPMMTYLKSTSRLKMMAGTRFFILGCTIGLLPLFSGLGYVGIGYSWLIAEASAAIFMVIAR